MGIFYLHSSTCIGLEAKRIRVEVDISSGLPSFKIVGLPDAAISESKERIRSAIKNSGFSFPRTRVTVNLAPANIKKYGPSFDLPIALAILVANKSIKQTDLLSQAIICGELSLRGDIMPITGTILSADLARQQPYRYMVVPKENAAEATLINGVTVFSCEHLQKLVLQLNENSLTPQKKMATPQSTPICAVNFKDIRGQEHAKRALEIAASGSHNILLSGPPGSGKTMLARAFAGILPKLTMQEALDVTKIHSIQTDQPVTQLANSRPFRSPHHTSSSIALIGGGAHPKPGEVTKAHRGVLFLDEFPEFQRAAIENLRQPLEEGFVRISRANSSVEFPAAFSLIAAMNPCPCGYSSDPHRACQCTPSQISRYQQKLSGPLLDRIDICIEVPRISFDELVTTGSGEKSEDIQKRVQDTRNRQEERYKNEQIFTNSELNTQQMKRFIKLNTSCKELLRDAVNQKHLSPRAFTRTVKVARTIADLEESVEIKLEHLAEALQYRSSLFL